MMKSDDDKNSYKNHPERCMCMACAIVSIATEAAEVIDRLENELAEGNIEELRQQVADFRAERDALRRTLSRMFINPLAYAESQNWDCFKENSK
jgi:uncharacterized protein Yka (UPF0111/DUF47 family)